MLLKADAKGLEWRVKAFLSNDQAAIDEILTPGKDIHSENQERFKLPQRVHAKIFAYRMIFADAFGPNGFRAPAYAYANDAIFAEVSTSARFWEKVVERFFDKYQGMYQNSVALIREASTKGWIETPSGRIYKFTPYTKWNGESDWPRTKILNYPVQGFSADLMILARRAIAEDWIKVFTGLPALLINTVHDDVEADVENHPHLIYQAAVILEEGFKAMNPLCLKYYGTELTVPMEGEVKFGMSLFEKDMTGFNRETFYEDFKQHGVSKSN